MPHENKPRRSPRHPGVRVLHPIARLQAAVLTAMRRWWLWSGAHATAARNTTRKERTVNSTCDVIVLGSGAARGHRSAAQAAGDFDVSIVERELAAGLCSCLLTSLLPAGAR
jgi:hypothetical protein